jgi:hypothetical protein
MWSDCVMRSFVLHRNRVVARLAMLLFAILLSAALAAYWASSGSKSARDVIVQLSHPRRVLANPQRFALVSEGPHPVLQYQLTHSISNDEQWHSYSTPIEVSHSVLLGKRASRAGNESFSTLIAISDIRHQTNERCVLRGYPRAWNGDPPDYEMDARVMSRVDDAQISRAIRALPIVAIAVRDDDAFGVHGIYAAAKHAESERERWAYFEFIDTAGRSQVETACGIRIHGGGSRDYVNTPKHSLRIKFRKRYGRGTLRIPLFDPEAASKLDSLVLRAMWNDSWTWRNGDGRAQFVRDEFARQLQEQMGHRAVRGRFVHLFINAMYWGIYNLVERPDEHFAAACFGGTKDERDVIKDGKVLNGDRNAWNKLLDVTEAIRNEPDIGKRQENFSKVAGHAASPALADLISLIDYMIVNAYLGTNDWPDKNYVAIRRRSNNSTGFQFLVWDAELTLGNESLPCILDSWTGVAEPYANLLRSEDFQEAIRGRLSLHFGVGGALYVNPEQSSWSRDARKRPTQR